MQTEVLVHPATKMPGQRYESEDVDIAPLAQPLQLEFFGQTAKNRLMKAAMTERMASWDPKDVRREEFLWMVLSRSTNGGGKEASV